MTNKKPLILVCNDDGIFAPGIKALVQVVSQLGDVVVVAPDSAQSGKGMAITISHPLRYRKVEFEGATAAYTCDGTPVDCMKLANNRLLPRKADLIVSGINHGSNSSVNVVYSGTMSAALEGCMEGIPAIGFSLCDHSIDANFEEGKTYIKQICETVLKNGLPKYTCLNVNIPKLPEKFIKGIKVCRQATGNWSEDFDPRQDPMGGEYFWLKGTFTNFDKGTDTDIWALENDYISIVPTHFDMTAHKAIETIANWKL